MIKGLNTVVIIGLLIWSYSSIIKGRNTPTVLLNFIIADIDCAVIFAESNTEWTTRYTNHTIPVTPGLYIKFGDVEATNLTVSFLSMCYLHFPKNGFLQYEIFAINLNLQSCGISFALDLVSICPVVLKVCTEYGSVTVVFCAKLFNNCTTERM